MQKSEKTVLITGIGGFVGHHVAEWFLEKTSWNLVGLDSWHPNHRGDRLRVASLQPYIDRNRLVLHKVDLTVPVSSTWDGLVFRSIQQRGWATEIDYVVNLASDSHVTRSIHDPASCWLNNTQLILNILEAFRANGWPKKFLHVSTDEVYGDAGWDGPGHPEWDTIIPSNPYSASKAAQESLCIAYWRTYEMPLILVNTMNIIAERQHPEKFLPMTVQRVLRNQCLDIHGDSSERIAKRVWLDAKNLADAMRFLLENLEPAMYRQGTGAQRPERLNIVGDTELDVLSFAQRVAGIMGRELQYQHVRGDEQRPGYDRRYALDGTKLSQIGWKPPFSFDQSLRRIVEWSIKHPEWVVNPRKS